MIELSLAEARTISITAQGLHRQDAGALTVEDALQTVGCIQLDTINVVRRSHELVLLSRSVSAPDAATALDGTGHLSFEYWGHAASLLPVAQWPLLGFRRRHLERNGWRGPAVDDGACRYVRSMVASLGEVTVTDLGGARGSGWERDAPAKWAAEWLLAIGELACVKRRGWSRVYQDASLTLPSEIYKLEMTDDECLTGLIRIALRCMGVATTDDIADYYRLSKELVAAYLADMDDVEPARVEGWTLPAWVDASSLLMHEVDRGQCTPLSPFDSLIWYRPRAKRLFKLTYQLEAYKPSISRECGYFGMPVLSGTEFAGRIAVRQRSGVTWLEGWQIIPGNDPEYLHRALHTAALWAGTLSVSAPSLCGPSCELVE